MLITSITGPSFEDIAYQLRQLDSQVDGVEFRFDHFTQLNLEQFKKLKEAYNGKTVFTFRSRDQGGLQDINETNRLEILFELCSLSPDYIDVEYDVPIDFIQKVKSRYPHIQIIRSYHDFTQIPSNLEEMVLKLIPHADVIKLAVYPHNHVEALHLVLLTQKLKAEDVRSCVLGMGEYGVVTRVLGHLFGSEMVYASYDDKTAAAPGQVTYTNLLNVYHFKKLNEETKIFGLIGDTLFGSRSHIIHNRCFDELGLNAVYLKLRLEPQHLEQFLELTKQLFFSGLSVTIPLKEPLVPLIDQPSDRVEEIGALNTLVYKNAKISGYNTDCSGALDAIERQEKVAGKRVIVLGAGGAARAIAYEAIKRKASVTILNRSVDRAKRIAQHFGCDFGSLEDMKEIYDMGYDILINTTSVGNNENEIPLDPQYIQEGSLVMDVVWKIKDTKLLKEALKRKCRVVYGHEMFVDQAVGQYRLWFGDGLDVIKARQVLRDMSF